MRIDPKVYFGSNWDEINNPKIKEGIMEAWENDSMIDNTHVRINEVLVFGDGDPIMYLFTDNIMSQCSKLKMTEKEIVFIIKHLSKITESNSDASYLTTMMCFLFKGGFYRFTVGQERCYFVRMWINEGGYISYTAYRLGVVGIGDHINDHVKELFQMLSFFFFSELKTIELKPGQKKGTRKNGNYNATKSNITIVDSNWNITSVRTEGFGVTGHFRMQPCGKGNKNRKITWVNSYQKYGYIRKSKKQI